jgi:hypothetical protein
VNTRWLFSAFAGVFCQVLIFAAITMVRHVSNRSQDTALRGLHSQGP